MAHAILCDPYSIDALIGHFITNEQFSDAFRILREHTQHTQEIAITKCTLHNVCRINLVIKDADLAHRFELGYALPLYLRKLFLKQRRILANAIIVVFEVGIGELLLIFLAFVVQYLVVLRIHFTCSAKIIIIS